jgi:hypothetical protein
MVMPTGGYLFLKALVALLWEYASACSPAQETRRSLGVANRECSAYAYCKSGLKKYTPKLTARLKQPSQDVTQFPV